MVRYGMVWYGMVRYSMVWYGTVWYGMVCAVVVGTECVAGRSGIIPLCGVTGVTPGSHSHSGTPGRVKLTSDWSLAPAGLQNYSKPTMQKCFLLLLLSFYSLPVWPVFLCRIYWASGSDGRTPGWSAVLQSQPLQVCSVLQCSTAARSALFCRSVLRRSDAVQVCSATLQVCAVLLFTAVVLMYRMEILLAAPACGQITTIAVAGEPHQEIDSLPAGRCSVFSAAAG